MLTGILFIISGFFFLIKGADMLVDGASAIARRFNVPDLVIGLTVVAFGTSAPEFFVNVIASIEGKNDLAFGNIAGSVIANILLVMGISSFIKPLSVTKGTVWREIPFAFFSTLLLGLFASTSMFFDGSSVISFKEGLIFLFFFIVFLAYSFRIAGKDNIPAEFVPESGMRLPVSVLFVLLGLSGLVGGGKIVVYNAVNVARSMGISESIIGLTVVAVGTCLPELTASVVASLKNKPDIAVGGIVGSNIFNVFMILGVSALISPIEITDGGYMDIAVMVGSSFILFLSMFTGRKHKIDRIEGLFFILFYGVYLYLRIFKF